MQKVIFTQGLPACGKSTWAKQFIEKNPTFVRVCRDDLRRMRGKYWFPSQEDMITMWENGCIIEALRKGHNVIVDATNLNPKFLEDKQKFISDIFPEIKFEIQDFKEVALDECIRRDKLREDSVGEKVIQDMYSRYIRPTEYKETPSMKQDRNKPWAIICDLDGTLALMNGRNPYDASTCENDLINEPVHAIIERFRQGGEVIIFVSGRDSKYRPQTLKFLEKCRFYKPLLFMRKEGDSRKDCIIKEEIFNEHIKDKYYVEFVLDDRDSVVALWRNMGLVCLQVNYGNF